MKSKLNCRRLSTKFAKNTRHPMVQIFERFFLMRLLQWNVRSSLPEVFCKKVFWKTLQDSQKNSRAGVFLWIWQKFYEHVFCRTSWNSFLWNVYIISLLKIILSNLRGNNSIMFNFFCYYGSKLPHNSPFFLNSTNYRRILCLTEDLNSLQ